VRVFAENIEKFTVAINERFDGAVVSSAVCITFISEVDKKLSEGTMKLNAKDERSKRGRNVF
jgi:hypothetical protein